MESRVFEPFSYSNQFLETSEIFIRFLKSRNLSNQFQFPLLIPKIGKMFQQATGTDDPAAIIWINSDLFRFRYNERILHSGEKI